MCAGDGVPNEHIVISELACAATDDTMGGQQKYDRLGKQLERGRQNQTRRIKDMVSERAKRERHTQSEVDCW